MTYNYNVHLIVTCIVFYCTHVLKVHLIFFHLEMHLLLIMQYGLVIITTCCDYINKKNEDLNFATSLMMSQVTLFDN
jgi:hypothetical protein